DEDIYLYTTDVTVTCPVANFSASPQSGDVGTPVNFTDLTTPAADHWRWDFGDGSNSTDQNPVHVYSSTGTYQVSLTVNTPYCRNQTPVDPTRIIPVGSAPVAGFTANATSGMIPLTVQFTNTSIGWQKDWMWDFGDGGTSTLPNPVHTFTRKGAFDITLTTGNDIGSNTTRKLSYIHALEGASQQIFFTLDGISVRSADGVQNLSFDTSKTGDFAFDPAAPSLLTCHPPAGSNLQQISLYSMNGDGFVQEGIFINGTITRSIFLSSPVATTNFTEEIGNPVTVNYTLDYPGYPDSGSLAFDIYDDTGPDYSDLRTVAQKGGFTSIYGVPYVMRFVRTG
ncbi:PKD domain-containing protein, partial [Methanoregula sp.]|uniref:PKD domain-containing protein n=1 Tax=Methanoregula sp. TaxID=2052170 RepID=UPI000CAACBF5